MKVARNLRLLDVDQLADECADQTARFFSGTTHDTSYCYELFRRAIVGCNQHAWRIVYDQYYSLVVSWVRNHHSLSAIDEEIDYFVNGAFEKMWSAVDPNRFGRFDDVADLLKYLQMCVNSVIVDHTRSSQAPSLDHETFDHLGSEDLASLERYVNDHLERQRLWKTLKALARDEREFLIISLSFQHGLKPSAIYAAQPHQFKNVDEIYQMKRNFLNRLRRNPIIRQFRTP